VTPGSVAEFIAQRGETITITRPSDVSVNLTAKAYCRLYRPNEIAGNVLQGDREVRIAATALSQAPLKGDRVLIGGKTTTVQFVWPAKIGEETAVHILQVRG